MLEGNTDEIRMER